MMAVGLVLFMLGFIGESTFPPSEYGWENRDIVSTIPILLGLMLCLASVVVWAWRQLP